MSSRSEVSAIRIGGMRSVPNQNSDLYSGAVKIGAAGALTIIGCVQHPRPSKIEGAKKGFSISGIFDGQKQGAQPVARANAGNCHAAC